MGRQVVRQHRRDEALHAALARGGRERLGERRPEAALLQPVGDHERDLGDLRVAGQADPAPDADEHVRVLRAHRDERDVVVEVHLGEVAQLALAQRALRGEESLVDALVREVLEPRCEQGLVVRPDGPDEHVDTVVERHDHRDRA